MKLYYSQGACSLAPHIALREAGLKFDLVQTSLKTHTVAGGGDYYAVNPKGQVPLLELDDGQHLTEVAAIVQYVADRVPASGLAPTAGTLARYRLLEWLSFIGTELHKSFAPLFNPGFPAEGKPFFLGRLKERFAYVDRQLEGRAHLLGDAFTVADAYLFTVQSWAQYVGLDLSDLPHLAAWRARVAARPGVKAAFEAEGLKA